MFCLTPLIYEENVSICNDHGRFHTPSPQHIDHNLIDKNQENSDVFYFSMCMENKQTPYTILSSYYQGIKQPLTPNQHVTYMSRLTSWCGDNVAMPPPHFFYFMSTQPTKHDAETVRQALDDIVDNLDKIKQVLRQTLTDGQYQQFKYNVLGNIEKNLMEESDWVRASFEDTLEKYVKQVEEEAECEEEENEPI